MSGSIRMAGRSVLAAAVVAGLGVAVPAVASARIAPGIGIVSSTHGAAGAVQAAVIRASGVRAGGVRAGGKAVPGFASGIDPPDRAGLGGISCPAASFCVAVGSYLDPLFYPVASRGTSGPRHIHPLAEEWNGRSWRVMPGMNVDNPVGVSCTSARFCMAVGGRRVLAHGFYTFKPQIGRWDGRRWTTMRPPPGPGHLSGVSCAGASFCVAVGSEENDIYCLAGAVWRGTAWHATTMPAGTCGQGSASFLSRVSCASGSHCIAVGAIGLPEGGDGSEPRLALAMGWNGKTWRVLDLAGASGPDRWLTSVSCPDASFCLAVGVKSVGFPSDTYSNMALAWDGTTWTELSAPPGPVGSDVSSVWCASAGGCVAVGGNQALTWNGTAWTAQTITQPESTVLGDLSCWRPSACMTVGSYTRIELPDPQPDGPGGARLTLAEQWNGRTWQPRRIPSPGDEQEGLSGLSCRSAANCMAVGAYVNGSDVQASLAEHWNGGTWHVLPAPDPGPDENVLTAISCPAADRCIAVGYYDTAGDHQALAEQWNGRTWTTLPIPHDGVLTGVSCPAVSNCMAVGTYVPPGQRAPLALSATWDGSTWTIQASPAPGGSLTEFNAVACPTRTRCIAVGDYFSDVSGNLLPLTALWNGTAWTMLTTPGAGGANAANSLTSISCSRPRDCMAVGMTFHRNVLISRALAESWDGTRWTVRPTAKLTIKIGVHMNAVSCPAPARCRSAGGYLSPVGNGFVLAEAWNGATWRRLAPITDPSTAFTDLYAIACPAVERCIAVGGTEIQHTLAYQWNGTRWQRLHTPTP